MLEQGSVSRGVWGLMSEDRKTTGTFLLPVGTVTFLLADVEGSTRQWEADGEAMADAMASLDGVAADAVARHAREFRVPFPVLRDEGAKVADRFAAARTPEAFVLDGARTVRYRGRIDDRYDKGTQRVGMRVDNKTGPGFGLFDAKGKMFYPSRTAGK